MNIGNPLAALGAGDYYQPPLNTEIQLEGFRLTLATDGKGIFIYHRIIKMLLTLTASAASPKYHHGKLDTAQLRKERPST